MNNPKKILVIKLRALGDTVLMTAPLLELHQKFPDADIHVAVTHHWAPLLQEQPGVTRIWPVEKRSDAASKAKAIGRLGLKLIGERYDWVINFHASTSSSLLAFGTGCRKRAIHFHGHHHANRFSTVSIPGKGIVKPIIERDMDCLRGMGLEVPVGKLPSVFLKKEELEAGRFEVLEALGEKPFLAIAPGASRATKCWPFENYLGVAKNWVSEKQGGVVLVTGPMESELINQWRANGPKETFYAHKLPLRNLASILSNCQAFLGNDSGPKHLAASVGCPTLTLVGPEDPYEWHPYPLQRHPFLYIPNLNCRVPPKPGLPPWCSIDVCVEHKHQCMNLISTKDVIRQLQELLA